MKIKVLLLCVLVLTIVSCTAQDAAYQEAVRNAQNAEYYIQVNGLERKNYNWRQEIADDPTTILWCTSAFPVPSSPFITVPIMGKLTSGAKRPYSTDPGPGGMYGSSGEYRYGFGPAVQ